MVAALDGWLTYPIDSDTDDDGIEDGEEVVAGLDGYITDPVDSDTDEVMVVAIREVTGEDLKNVREKLQAQKLNQGFQDVGMDMFQFINSLFTQ